jgi:glucokinase
MILAGDIGGTKSLLALYEAVPGEPSFVRTLASHDFDDPEALLTRFLGEAHASLGGVPRLEAGALGVAGPVTGGRVQVTNLPWVIDARALAKRFGIGRLRLLNDFAAAAQGVEALAPRDLATLQEGEQLPGAARVVLGAGTGLGVAYLVAGGGAHHPLPGEGGHAGFAPANEEQAALWSYLRGRGDRVEQETVLSGSGLMRIYDFLLHRRAHPESAALRAEMAESDAPAAISRHALEHGDPLASAALDLFVACYGAAAGDHALNVMARGGVFVAGGIARKILPRIAAGGFLRAFNDKGHFSAHARRMPVHVVTNERIGLLGAALAAAAARKER